MQDFKTFLDKLKQSKQQQGQKQTIRVPLPDKEWAKQNGAKWDMELKSYIFYSNTPDEHTLKDYQKSSNNWLKLTQKLPYDPDGILKTAGVVTDKENDVWVSYVLAVEKYKELIEYLNDGDFL